MIGKQEKGRSFRGCLKYVLEKTGAERIGGNVLGTTVDYLAAEFNAIRSLNHDLGVAVHHAMLSVAAHERRTDTQWQAIGADYLNRMGFEHCQYLIVRHTDEEHDHVHIVASRIQIPSGKTVPDSFEYRRSEAAIRELEQIYGLEPVQSSRGQLNHAPSTGEVRRFEKEKAQYEQGLRDLPPRPPILMVLQALITRLCTDQPTMSELVERLRESGVEVRVSLTKKQQLGISYQFAGEHYSGTQLGAAYQFGGLQRHQGVSYEPERDEGIRTELVGGHRTTAAVASADPPVAPAVAADAAAEFDFAAAVAEPEFDFAAAIGLAAAVERLDFWPGAAAQQIRAIGSQSLEVAADAGRFSDAAESLIEQEIFESVAADFERVRDCLERDRETAERTNRLRSQLAELARTALLQLGQFQRDYEQEQVDAEETEADWLTVAHLAIDSAQQMLAMLGSDSADGSRFVSGRRYQIEQQGSILTISESAGQSVLFRYDSDSQTYSSDCDLCAVQEMAEVLERAVSQIPRKQAMLELAHSFSPEFGYSVPSLAAIEQAETQVERVGRQIQPLKRQLVELTSELRLLQEQADDAGLFQSIAARLTGEPQRLEQLQLQQRDLARTILTLQKQQKEHQATADSAQAARQREEERLNGIYQHLSQQVQQSTGLQERRAIDEAVAFIILSSGKAQTERNLEALDFSPSVGQWRKKHSEQQQISRYVQEILDQVKPEQPVRSPQIRGVGSNQSELEIE